MAAKNNRRDRQPSSRTRPEDEAPFRLRATAVKARRRSQDGAWELVHPRCALVRADDLEEVEEMIAGGELEVAKEELRWLLDGCGDFIAAHRLLGAIAMDAEDFKLARGHFGYAFEIGWSALTTAKGNSLPYRLPANQACLESAKGLAWCLKQIERTPLAIDVVAELVRLDSTDPLGVSPWLSEWHVDAKTTSGAPGPTGPRDMAT